MYAIGGMQGMFQTRFQVSQLQTGFRSAWSRIGPHHENSYKGNDDRLTRSDKNRYTEPETTVWRFLVRCSTRTTRMSEDNRNA